MLTDTAIKATRATGKPLKLFDERGLFLLVKPNGARLWRFKYVHAGREKLLSLGIYPDVTLKRARDKRDDARRQVADGVDPSDLRKAERVARADTFRAIAQEWVAVQSKTLAPETIAIYKARLESVLYPAFGSKPIKSITAGELLRVLRSVEARGKHESAHRVRALAGRVFRFAIATDRAERDLSADLKGALTPVKTQHYAAITKPARMAELLRAIDGYVGQPSAALALRLAPLVFVRPGELRGAEWSEFDLDAKQPEWRIPAARMKMDEEHIVPLSRQALAILRELQSLTGDGKFLFPGLRGPDRPISDNTLNSALRRLGFSQKEMTVHGFRTMASTRLNEMNFSPDVIERQLAHVEKDAVRSAYNRATKLAERREMMQAWADYLDGLKADGKKIVAIKRGATASV